MSFKQKPQVVFVLGGPGAGKGTQCSNIAKTFGFVHLSAGDLLREECSKKGSQYGEMINEYIKNGQIVPVAVTCSLIENAMKNSNSHKFLIDGFPRNQDNVEGWTQQMAEQVKLIFVLFFDCSQEVCTNRCLGRGAAGSGRTDDNMDSLKKRFQTYVKDTMPIIQFYEKQNLLQRIDANDTPEEVFNKVRALFNNVNSDE